MEEEEKELKESEQQFLYPVPSCPNILYNLCETPKTVFQDISVTRYFLFGLVK